MIKKQHFENDKQLEEILVRSVNAAYNNTKVYIVYDESGYTAFHYNNQEHPTFNWDYVIKIWSKEDFSIESPEDINPHIDWDLIDQWSDIIQG